MKLTCVLEINSQLAQVKVKKASTCILALCKDKKDMPILLACTKQNMAGQKYELKNLKKVFSKFLKNGMATLSFAAPPHDLLIRKADPLQLQSFVHFLANADKSKLHFSAPPTRIEQPMATRMSVTQRSGLPMAFPKSLESLSITELGLLKVPTSVWKLSRLACLVLASNALDCVPPELSQLQNLRTLDLSRNNLTHLQGFAQLRMLQELRLNCNQLSRLPDILCDLPALSRLEVQANVLTVLPDAIGRMKRLKCLDAAANKIEVLPSSFMCLRLNHLNLFENPLSRRPAPGQRRSTTLPSLKEWASQVILEHRLPFSAESLPYTLVSHLEEQRVCCAVCSRPVCSAILPSVVMMDLRSFAHEYVAVDTQGRSSVPVEVIKCFTHCQREPRKARHTL